MKFTCLPDYAKAFFLCYFSRTNQDMQYNNFILSTLMHIDYIISINLAHQLLIFNNFNLLEFRYQLSLNSFLKSELVQLQY